MKDGVIADFTVTEQMLKQFIRMAHPSHLFAPNLIPRAVGGVQKTPEIADLRRVCDPRAQFDNDKLLIRNIDATEISNAVNVACA